MSCGTAFGYRRGHRAEVGRDGEEKKQELGIRNAAFEAGERIVSILLFIRRFTVRVARLRHTPMSHFIFRLQSMISIMPPYVKLQLFIFAFQKLAEQSVLFERELLVGKLVHSAVVHYHFSPDRVGIRGCINVCDKCLAELHSAIGAVIVPKCVS